jgi:hypothetical protein
VKAETMDKLAALAHEQWSGWMQYMFSKGTITRKGDLVIPSEFVTRWHRQMNTPYDCLPDAEKESDKREADRVLAVLLSQYTLSPRVEGDGE